nr:AIR synthase-related protein [Halogeometricum sp. CBA1124]
MHEEAADLGVSIVTGHTARYAGCSFPWVGGATALAVGDPGDVIRPDGARVGDDVLVTKGPAVEATGLLTTLFPDQFDLPADTLREAQARLDEADCVRDAMTAAAAGGVHAMHDATECGLFGALNEVADGAGATSTSRPTRYRFARASARRARSSISTRGRRRRAARLVLAVDPDSTAAVVSALESEGRPSASPAPCAKGPASPWTASRCRTPRWTRRGRPTRNWRGGASHRSPRGFGRACRRPTGGRFV